MKPCHVQSKRTRRGKHQNEINACHNIMNKNSIRRSWWTRGLRVGSAAVRLLRLGSNPGGGMDVCLLCVLYLVRERSLGRADHLFRGALPSVCVCDLVTSSFEDAWA